MDRKGEGKMGSPARWFFGEAALLVNDDIAPVVGDSEGVANEERKKTVNS
jgi:hypothetical protein